LPFPSAGTALIRQHTSNTGHRPSDNCITKRAVSFSSVGLAAASTKTAPNEKAGAAHQMFSKLHLKTMKRHISALSSSTNDPPHHHVVRLYLAN